MPLPLLPPTSSLTTATLPPPPLPPPPRCGHRHRRCCQHPHPHPHSFCHPVQKSIRTEPINNAPAVTHSYCDTATRTDWCNASVTNCQGACQGRWVQATAAHAKGSQLAAVSTDPKAVLYDLAATASDSVQQLSTYPLGQLGTGTREWGPGMDDPVGERISAFAAAQKQRTWPPTAQTAVAAPAIIKAEDQKEIKTFKATSIMGPLMQACKNGGCAGSDKIRLYEAIKDLAKGYSLDAGVHN